MKNLFAKHIFLLLISCVSVLGCSPDKSKEFPYYKSDLEKMNLRGKVKTFREYSYKAIDSFGKISKGQRQDKEGFAEYQPHIILPRGGYFTFNKSGFFMKILTYEYFLKLTVINSTPFWTETGAIKDKAENTSIYTYNEKENKIEVNSYDINAKFQSKEVFKYNDEGYLIDRSVYLKDGRLFYKDVYEYNKKDNQVNCSFYYLDGLERSTSTKYDNKGNIIQTKEVNFQRNSNVVDNFTITYFEYDNQGNLIKSNSNTTYNDESWDNSSVFKYNKYGDIIEFIDSSSTKGKSTYEYEYDSHHNWIKRIEFFRSVPEFILERKIEYY